MIDFVKLNLSYLSDKAILSGSVHDVFDQVDRATGEVKKISFRYHNMEGLIYPSRERKELKGSLHILFNAINDKGPINGNQFFHSDLIKAIDHLQESLLIDPDRTIIENIEVGINVTLPFSVEQFLIDSLIAWHKKPTTKNLEFDSMGKYCQFNTSTGYLKHYDKALQQRSRKDQPLKDFIYRLEHHYTKNRPLAHKFDIVHLSDLKIKDNMIKVFLELIQTFDKTVFVDQLKPLREFDKNELILWNKATNPKTYEHGWTNRTAYKRFKDQFNDLLRKYSLDKRKRLVRSLLLKEGIKLLEVNQDQESRINSALTDCNAFTTLYTVKTLHIEKESRVCPVSSIDISGQRSGSIYISTKTLREMCLTGHKEFIKVAYMVNIRKPMPYNEQEYFERLAHAIRCKGNYDRRKKK